MRTRQLCGHVREVVASDIGVTPYFVEGGVYARQPSIFEKVGNTTQQEVVVVIVLCTCGTGVGMVMSDL